MSVVCPICGGNLAGYNDPVLDRMMYACKAKDCEMYQKYFKVETLLTLHQYRLAWDKEEERASLKFALNEVNAAAKQMYDYLTRDDASEKEFEVAAAYQKARIRLIGDGIDIE